MRKVDIFKSGSTTIIKMFEEKPNGDLKEETVSIFHINTGANIRLINGRNLQVCANCIQPITFPYEEIVDKLTSANAEEYLFNASEAGLFNIAT